MADPQFSVVVPLRDEEPNVAPLCAEIRRALDGLGRRYEVILIDDGSTDGTYREMLAAHREDPRIATLRFTRNFGQTAAFAAGFAEARGAFIVTIDGDLQNDPADIPRLLTLAEQQDVVVGWRRYRQDAMLTRRVPSVIANYLLGVVSGVPLHDNGCSLKVFRAEVVKPLKLQPGMHRFLPALASRLGSRIVEVEVGHRARRHGRSKYGLSRTFQVIADLRRLRRLMRAASDPSTPTPHLYDIAERHRSEP